MATAKRLRWTAFLCCHALANMAYYRGGWDGPRLKRHEKFWRRANGNFLDIAVLEWCKLFGDEHGAHAAENVVSDPEAFRAQLFAHLAITPAEFQAYMKGMLRYRDKFVAHLDKNAKAKYPQFDVAIESTKFLFRYLRSNEEKDECFAGLPRNPDSMYRLALTESQVQYEPTPAA